MAYSRCAEQASQRVVLDPLTGGASLVLDNAVAWGTGRLGGTAAALGYADVERLQSCFGALPLRGRLLVQGDRQSVSGASAPPIFL